MKPWICVYATNRVTQMRNLKQNANTKRQRLGVAVIWFQYLHPENVKQSSHASIPCSLACKREKNTHSKVIVKAYWFNNCVLFEIISVGSCTVNNQAALVVNRIKRHCLVRRFIVHSNRHQR